MTRFELSLESFDPEILRRPAVESDAVRRYRDTGVYCLSGEPTVIYGDLEDSVCSDLRQACRSIEYRQEVRTTSGGSAGDRGRPRRAKKEGLGQSRTFGFRPPVHFSAYGKAPALTSLWSESPAEHEVICRFGEVMDEVYRKAAPEVHRKHEIAASSVLPEYRIPRTLFTSGIINQNNPLKYHFDRGNFEGLLSCMVVFRNLTEGGHLILPGFGAAFELRDRSFLLFDGQKHLHGVTPIRKMNRSSYRYSVVYYSLKAMAKCRPLDEELKKARMNRMEIERRRI